MGKKLTAAASVVTAGLVVLGAAGCSTDEGAPETSTGSTSPARPTDHRGMELPRSILARVQAGHGLTAADLECEGGASYMGGFRQVNEWTGHADTAPRLSAAAESPLQAAAGWSPSPLNKVYVVDRTRRSPYNAVVVRSDSSIASLLWVGRSDGNWYVQGYVSCDKVPGSSA